MAFDNQNFNRDTAGNNTNAPFQYSYYTSTETLAQVKASGYFDDVSGRLAIGSKITVTATDGSEDIAVTALSPNVTTTEWVSFTELDIPQGGLIVGDAAGKASTLAIGAANTVLHSNGTTASWGQVVPADFADDSLTVIKLNPGSVGDVLMTGASGHASWENFSQDVSVASDGVVTVIQSTGAFAIGTTERHAGITTSSGPAAVPVTGRIHEITTTGAGDALTLANGVNGQRFTLCYVAEGAGGDTAVLTPATLAGGTNITFNALGDTAELVYLTNGGWYMVGGSAVLA